MTYETDPGETGPSTVLSDPACVKEDQKEEMDTNNQFVVKEEEGEMTSKEEEVEEAICPTTSKEEDVEEAIWPTIVPCEYWLYVSMKNNFGLLLKIARVPWCSNFSCPSQSMHNFSEENTTFSTNGSLNTTTK